MKEGGTLTNLFTGLRESSFLPIQDADLGITESANDFFRLKQPLKTKVSRKDGDTSTQHLEGAEANCPSV